MTQKSGDAMVTLYGIRGCDTCRRAKCWLEKRNVEFRFVDIRRESLDASQIERWQSQVGWQPLINKKSITWRKIPEFDRINLQAENARDLILAYPTVMKRPVLVLGDKSVLGFDERVYAELEFPHNS